MLMSNNKYSRSYKGESMKKDDQKTDELIERIAQRVLDKLEALTPSEHVPEIDCTHLQTGCINCGLCIVKKPASVDHIIKHGASRIGANPGISGDFDKDLAGMIDHTILKPDATREELIQVCEEAKKYHFATVCVNSSNIALVARQLRASGVDPIAVVGFPLGAATTQAKVFEAKEAIHDGAQEIDMVINIGALKSREYQKVYDDIAQVVNASKPHKVKVIIETAQLTCEEKVEACVLAKTAGAAFVKTSTGFGGGGATVEDIELMRKVVGPDMEIKASGGIRTKEDAKAMVEAGANRIGASASVAIVTGANSKKKSKY